MSDITRPTGEQLLFVSSKTGNHVLDDYMEAAEIGGRRLDELLSQVFDPVTGDFDGALFEFRVDPTGGNFEYRVGTFIDPDEGWADTGQTIFNPRGDHAESQTYARLDCVSYDNEFYICVVPHVSTATLNENNWAKVLDQNPLNEAVDTAEFFANQAISAAASITGAVNIPTQTFAGTGVQTDYTLTLQPSSAEALLVTVDHIVQQPTIAYTLAGNTLTFTTAPANGTVIVVRYLGGTLNQMPVQPRAGTFTLAASDGFKVQNCSAALTMNLPAAAAAGNGFLVIVKTNGFAITLDPNGAELIDGLATKAFGTDFWIWCDGTKWISFNPQGPIATVFGRVGAVTAQANDYTATQITNTPAGNLAATTVQAALNELDAEKAPLVHTHAIADTTGLQAALDGKAALVHTHAIADVTNLQTTLDGKQPLDATLTAIAGAATGANVLHYFSGTDTVATTTLSSFGRSLIDDADAAAGRATLGLGSLSTLNTVGSAQVDNNAITLAKLAQISSGSFLARSTGGIGNVEEVPLATIKTALGLAGNNTGDQTITLTGDVTGSGPGSFAATIANDAVTNAKLANMATARIKGRLTASTGDPEDLTGTQVTTMLDVFTSALKGLAPASGGGTANFLRADGTWAAPASGGAPSAPLQLEPQAGRVYSSPFMNLLNTPLICTQNEMVAIPVPLSAAKTWTKVLVSVMTAGVVGDVARLGIYSNVGGLPGDLIVDAGEISLAATGDIEATISQPIGAEIVWLALNYLSGGGLPEFRGPPAVSSTTEENGAWTAFVFGRTTPLGSGGQNTYGVRKSQTYGPMPATFGAIDAYTNFVPFIGLRHGV